MEKKSGRYPMKPLTMIEYINILKKNLGTTKLVGRIRKTH